MSRHRLHLARGVCLCNHSNFNAINVRDICANWRAYLLEMAVMIPYTRYVPIRPRINPYDKNYYHSNLKAYLESESGLGSVCFTQVFEGTIQEWEANIISEGDLADPIRSRDSSSMMYWMNDVHYYLSSWEPHFDGYHWISGGMFSKIPGSYSLPCKEGTYVVSGVSLVKGQETGSEESLHGHVTMITNGTGASYDHPLVEVDLPDKLWDFGWYRLFSKIVHTRDFKIIPIWVPPFTSCKSIQAKFICDYLDKSLARVGGREDFASTNSAATHSIGIPWNDAETVKFTDSMRWYIDGEKESGLVDSIKSAFWSSDPRKKSRIRKVTQYIQSLSLSSATNYVVSGVSAKRFFFSRYDTISADNLNDVRCVSTFNWIGPRGILYHEDKTKENWRTLPAPRQASIALGRSTDIMDRLLMKEMTPCNANTKLIKQIIAEEISSDNVKIKGSMKDKLTESKLQSKDYFYVKPIEDKLIKPIHHSIRVESEDGQAEIRSQENVAAVSRWLHQHPRPVYYGKGDTLLEDVNKCRMLKTGYDVIMDGQPSTEFEWSHKSVHNAIYGIYGRHLAPTIAPQEEALTSFKEMCNRFWKWFAIEWDSSGNWEELIDFCPMEWVDTKSTFNAPKRRKYAYTILRQLAGLETDMIGTFTTMVKSGETYYSETDLELCGQGMLHGQDSRPRNICVVCEKGSGLPTAFQSCMWGRIKKILPGFVQGLTKEQLEHLFQSNYSTDFQSISLDGSSFDSTQFAELMKLVDDGFWDVMHPRMKTALHSNRRLSFRGCDTDKLVDDLIRSVKSHDTILFTHVPDLNGKEWVDSIKKSWIADHAQSKRIDISEKPWLNWLATEIRGTTFSGHPTKTTLGNTFRSLLYGFWYIEKTGIREPWLSGESLISKNSESKWVNEIRVSVNIGLKPVWIAAAGDDVVMGVRNLNGLPSELHTAIMANSSRVKEGSAGLGQVIKDIRISEWWDIDFCSKWAFTCDGTIGSWRFYRDQRKAISTKHWYVGNNMAIITNPSLHAKALLDGVLHEHSSGLVEDFFRFRARDYERKDRCVFTKAQEKTLIHNWRVASQRVEWINNDHRYNDEVAINNKLGLSVVNFLQFVESGMIGLGCTEEVASTINFRINATNIPIINEEENCSDRRKQQGRAKCLKEKRELEENGVDQYDQRRRHTEERIWKHFKEWPPKDSETAPPCAPNGRG
nr:MAG: hypothetical protein [Crogonang virus 25]